MESYILIFTSQMGIYIYLNFSYKFYLKKNHIFILGLLSDGQINMYFTFSFKLTKTSLLIFYCGMEQRIHVKNNNVQWHI